MPKIFISYRRDDSIVFAGRICDRLAAHFGKDSVFMDVDSIPFGVDFRQHLTDAVSGCDVFLALIGEAWLTVNQNGQCRLDDPRDFVRIEIEAALARGISVIPVLLGKATMPREEELPSGMAALAYRNAANIDAGRDFHSHMDRLIRGLPQLAPMPKAKEIDVSASTKTPVVAPNTAKPVTKSSPTDLPPGYFPCSQCGFISVKVSRTCPSCNCLQIQHADSRGKSSKFAQKKSQRSGLPAGYAPCRACGFISVKTGRTCPSCSCPAR